MLGQWRDRGRNSIHGPGALDGIDFIFIAQHDDAPVGGGGWPQYHPLRGGYSDDITFNDNLHVNVMKLLDELVAQVSPFDIVPFTQETRTQGAISRNGVHFGDTDSGCGS